MKKISPRRKNRHIREKRESTSILLKLLILVLIPVIVFVYIKLNTKYWNGLDKMGIATQDKSGDISVVLLDPSLHEETEFLIPGDTEVDVSQNLGIIRLKNVNQLSVNEGLSQTLLPKTITKSFLFPIYLWSDQSPSSLKFITTRNTNIPIGDRIAIAFFANKLNYSDVAKIDLAKSQFLTKTKLSDGEVGYKIPGEVSQRLTFYFSDNTFSEKGTKVYIKDATGTFGTSERAGKIVEVMGAKVISLEKIQKEEMGCLISGKDKEASVKISRLFDCKLDKTPSEFDVEIKLGTKFVL